MLTLSTGCGARVGGRAGGRLEFADTLAQGVEFGHAALAQPLNLGDAAVTVGIEVHQPLSLSLESGDTMALGLEIARLALHLGFELRDSLEVCFAVARDAPQFRLDFAGALRQGFKFGDAAAFRFEFGLNPLPLGCG